MDEEQAARWASASSRRSASHVSTASREVGSGGSSSRPGRVEESSS
jgi:hypothetical protein